MIKCIVCEGKAREGKHLCTEHFQEMSEDIINSVDEEGRVPFADIFSKWFRRVK